ncbi:MAG: hypothetical protein LQ338_004538 [Usnochroma carphineum]|nr:MAG: hypothetical protein LQ338_004538 [Usnochroma carphineum]
MPTRKPVSPDFQALILCGPGVSLNTFTSTPEDFPKALVPIANRPMVWYPLDWCYRMNVSRISLVTPSSSCKAIENALSRNPDLTSLPHPRPDIIAPEYLSQNTGTAEILRLPEVQAAISGHFLVLPCDILSALPGESLLEAWMVQAAGIVGNPALPGGLGVWFPTKGEHAVKGEETNFLVTAQTAPATAPPARNSLRPSVSQVVYSSTTDTLHDITESKHSLPIRHGLLRKHGRIRMLTTTRDAHIYLFPYWILDFLNRNPTFDSIGEDIVGWWAKATWQDGLVPKLGLAHILDPSPAPNGVRHTEDGSNGDISIEDEIDLASMSSTHVSHLLTPPTTPSSVARDQPKSTPPTVPPFLAYVHPTNSPLIRRIDTSALLLHASLYIAALDPSTSSLTHPQKIHPTCSIAPRTTISQDVLIGANTTVNQHATIKSSVIGANCVIGAGARLTKCVLMDEVEVGEKAVLTGVVVGPRARVGKECKLGEGCEVQPGFVVEERTEAKGEKFMVFEGLDEEDDYGEGEAREDMELDMGNAVEEGSAEA